MSRVPPKLAGCLLAHIAVLAIVAVLAVVSALRIIAFGNFLSGPSEEERIASWHTQVAELNAGKTTTLIWPEPLRLEEFVRDQPELAAKVKSIYFYEGKVADERFGLVKQFANLEEIDFELIWEGTDAFLGRIAGMKSITTLSFYQTQVSEDGARAIASFPNLNCLRLHYFNLNDAGFQQLRGHKGIKNIFLENVALTDVLRSVLASLPNLEVLDLEEDKSMSEADFQKLQKALPKVKITRGT